MGILSHEESDRRNTDMLLSQDVPLWLGTPNWSHTVISVNLCVSERNIPTSLLPTDVLDP